MNFTLTNYWWLLLWILGPGFLIDRYFPKIKENILGKSEVRTPWLPAIVIAIPYVLWAGYRPRGMGDTGAYMSLINLLPNGTSGWGDYLAQVKKDKGFSVLLLIINLFTRNRSLFIFLILAAFQLFALVKLFRKYSNDYWYSMFVFIATTDYISWMQNGIRQFTAVTIIVLASDFIFQKKYVPAIAFILLASTMHQSALLMIPIIFIVQGKAWNKKTILCVIAAILALVFVGQFTDLLEMVLSDTQYTNVVSDWNDFNDNGTNPLRVLLYAVPTLLSIIGYRYIKEEDDPVINIATNMGILSTAIYMISMGTSGIFIGRLPIYVSLYSMNILLPWEIDHMFTQKSAVILKVLSVGMFAFFFYYQMHSWGWI